jgi:hypothetical protein
MRITSWIVVMIGAVLPLSNANALFKCVDEKGRTHIEETPPPACANSLIQETNRSGSVIRTIEPTANKSEKGGDAAATPAEARKAGEQKRRDQVLVDSYSSEREIDAARDRNLELLNSRLSGAQSLVKRGEAREKELQPLAARNPQHANDLQRVKAELATDMATVARLERELAATNQQFAADKKRWAELKSGKK